MMHSLGIEMYYFGSGAEQELNLAKNSMEAASNGLFSASNELSVASLKAKSASGHTDFCYFYLSCIIM